MPRFRKPMPPDFARYADKEGNLKLRKRFGVGGLTIELWRRQLGVRFTPPAPKHVPKMTVARRVKRYARLPDERIEELADFGTDSLATALDLRTFEREW
jgi:hypothetical protein